MSTIYGNPIIIPKTYNTQPRWEVNKIDSVYPDICYGNGKFVAVGRDNTSGSDVLYSIDGINWKTSTAQTLWTESVCYGNGKFVAVGHKSNSDVAAMYSTDGINWNYCSALPVSKVSLLSVTCNNDKFVAVGQLTVNGSSTSFKPVIMYSTDGINWIQSTLPAYTAKTNSIIYTPVCYGNGKFVTIITDDSSTSNYILSSTDGIGWSKATLPVSTGWISICYGNGKFVATSMSDVYVYSTDGITWTKATLPSSHWWRVCYGNGKFVAAYGIAGGTEWGVIYSFDGVKWMDTTTPQDKIVATPHICYGEGKFVAIGAKQDKNYNRTVAYICDKWFSVYDYANQIPHSTDADGNVYNGVGYKSGVRLTSTGTEEAYSGMYLTGFIPVKLGHRVNLTDVTWQYGVTTGITSANQRICFYDANKAFIGLATGSSAEGLLHAQKDSNNIWTSFDVTSSDSLPISNVAYFRLCCAGITDASVIKLHSYN